MDNQLLWYTRPAEAWVEALPLGNGRIGAMDFGGARESRIALNEDSLWSGYPRDTNVQDAAQYFRKAQQLVLDGKHQEAAACIEDNMLGAFTQSYLPLGDLMLCFNGPEGEPVNYVRSLSLDEAVSATGFELGGITYRRELFVSHPDQVVVMRLSADRAGQMTLRAKLQSQLRASCAAEGDTLTLSGIAPSMVQPSYLQHDHPVVYEDAPELRGMRFCAILRAIAKGGKVESSAGELCVCGADEVVLLMAVRTSFNGFDRQPFVDGRDELALAKADLDTAGAKDYAALRSAHVADHQALYRRVTIALGGPDYADQSTEARLKGFSGQPDDRGLIEAVFQYGRYLTIAGSRQGTQPMNLQGIWNEELRAPWSSNYTVNINTQMNYWPAEVTALPELTAPLFALIDELRTTGARTAKLHYGARGAVSHHNTDLWRLSNPVGNKSRGTVGYAFWPMSFGWLCEHLYEHYQYTLDRGFLRDAALPAIRDAARFYLDTLTEDGRGDCSLFPTTSPEHAVLVNGEWTNVAASVTMSNAIVREVLENYLTSLDVLGLDEPMADEARAALGKLHPLQIGSKGQLLEWGLEYPEAEPHHRHASHMYPLHPAHQITPDKTPVLAAACSRSLDLRGDEGTGWSLGWKINFWARLRDGDRALRLLKMQLRFVEADCQMSYAGGGGTFLNLFDAHPPFQIDGNFGATAGIAEMFLQSVGNEMWLLPALPTEWDQGHIRGLRAQGGVSVDIEYRDRQLLRATLRRIVASDAPLTVHYQGMCRTMALKQGETAEVRFE